MTEPLELDPPWLPKGPQLRDESRRGAFEAGVRWAMLMIASRIRSELVCCTPEDIETMAMWMQGGVKTVHFHDICYWGEMSARLAEDPHSLLISPYECPGDHPGPCWSTKRCRKLEHVICETCFDCTVEGCNDTFCAQDGSCVPIGKEGWQ